MAGAGTPHFVRVPEDESAEIDEVKTAVTYGWGVIPVQSDSGRRPGRPRCSPRTAATWCPLRHEARRAEGVSLGDVVGLRLTLDV